MTDTTDSPAARTGMYAPERQAAILRHTEQHGRSEVLQLAADLEVTPETVRRDLTVLERAGRLRRVHGGAIALATIDFEPSVADRAESNAAEKKAIATAALAYVPPEGTIILDGGTTTARVAELLPRDRRLTVVTASLQVATSLVGAPLIRLHLLGGYVRSRTLTAVGAAVTGALADLRADVAFLGTNGMSDFGFSTPDQREAECKSAMVTAARRRIVLADHAKYGSDHFARFATGDDIDVVISDSGLPASARAVLTGAGSDVVIA